MALDEGAATDMNEYIRMNKYMTKITGFADPNL